MLRKEWGQAPGLLVAAPSLTDRTRSGLLSGPGEKQRIRVSKSVAARDAGGEGAETLIGCAGALRRQDEGGFHSWPARTGEECESVRQRKARLGLAVVESSVERAEALRTGHVDPREDNRKDRSP